MGVVGIERPAPGIVVLRLRRPEKLNALDRESLDGAVGGPAAEFAGLGAGKRDRW
jgi:hypothetical protein